MNRTDSAKLLLVAAILVSTFALICVGCGGGGNSGDDDEEQTRDKTIQYTVENRSGDDISDVAISGTSRAVGYGTIENGDSETLSDTELNIPKTIEVTWRDGRGDRHYAKVDLWRVAGKGYEGGIWITITRRQEVKAKKY